MIHKKLLEFQKLTVVLKKKGENPHFRSKYVPLNEVLEKIKPHLNRMNILILQIPLKDSLHTKLIDTEDDSFVESFMPYVEVTTAQKLGSNNTYNRRYSLVTLLNLEDEDDDGNEASAEAKPKRASKVANTAENKGLNDQRKRLMTLFKELSVDPFIIDDKILLGAEVKKLTQLEFLPENYDVIISRLEAILGERT